MREFGIWMSPSGQVYDVPLDIDHTAFVLRCHGLFGLSPTVLEDMRSSVDSCHSYSDVVNMHVLRKGWIQVRYYSNANCFVSFYGWNSDLLMSLCWYLVEQGFSRSFCLSLEDYKSHAGEDVSLDELLNGDILVASFKQDNNYPHLYYNQSSAIFSMALSNNEGSNGS